MIRPWLVTVMLSASSGVCTAQDSVFGRTDTQKEIEIGREVYDQALSQGLLSRNEAYVNRVERVFATLTTALPERVYPYQVAVIASSRVNAWCAPGGFVVIFEGLLSQMKSDDALAFVLAHEIGHGALRHAIRSLRKTQSDVVVGIFISILTGSQNNYADVRSFGHSRSSEREADDFAVETYIRAGFDSSKLTEAMLLLEHLIPDSGQVPYYLRDHPPHKERVVAIERKRAECLKAGLVPSPSSTGEVSIAKEAVFGVLPIDSSSPNPYCPLGEGTEWEYQVRNGEARSTYTLKVIGIADAGNGLSVARMRLDIGSSRSEYQCLTTAEAVWRRNRPERKRSSWTQEFSFPLTEGGSASDGRRTYRNMGREDVDTPSGFYKTALKLEVKDVDRTLILWFAEGVGLVRRLNPTTEVDELLSRFKAR